MERGETVSLSTFLYKGGIFRRAAGNFITVDHGMSLEEVAKKRPESIKPGYVFIPGEYHMKNGVSSRVHRDANSPYEIREEGSGGFARYEGEQKVENVYSISQNH